VPAAGYIAQPGLVALRGLEPLSLLCYLGSGKSRDRYLDSPADLAQAGFVQDEAGLGLTWQRHRPWSSRPGPAASSGVRGHRVIGGLPGMERWPGAGRRRE
jgi:hypothetical protein